MVWKDEIKLMIKKGCTDSDIEDYLSQHSGLCVNGYAAIVMIKPDYLTLANSENNE